MARKLEDGQEPFLFANSQERDEKLKQEITPFFQFHLFQNLRSLQFQLDDAFVHPLESWVSEAFTSLKNLKKIQLVLETRPKGSKFVLQGLINLPLLELFHIEIPFIRDNEWILLDQFFEKQAELASIHFVMSSEPGAPDRYKIRNKQTEDLWRFLEGKPKLQYLTINITHCSLNSLSKGLLNSTITNQLKLLSIEAIDDVGYPAKNAAIERCEGLCVFIDRQKESLIYLEINLPFVLDVNIIEHITSLYSRTKRIKRAMFGYKFY